MAGIPTRSFVAALTAVTGLAISANAGIEWKNSGDAEQARLVNVDPSAELTRAAQDGGDRIVVRFAAPVTPEQRATLAASGVNLLSPLGSQAYFANVRAGADVAAASNAANIIESGPIAASFKLHPAFTNGATPDYAIVADGQGFSNNAAADPIVAAYVQFHADVPVQNADLLADMALGGVEVIDIIDSVNTAVVELPRSAVDRFLQDARVQWIEPPLPRFGTMNDSNRVVTQSNTLQAAPENLTGQGITVFVYDGGTVRASHVDIAGKTTLVDSDGTSDHATHVAGTVLGDGDATGGVHRGMAPNATLVSAGFGFDGSGTFLYTNPGDLETDYAAAIANGADISNNSIGTNTSANGFPCTITGDYGLTAATIDAVARGSLGESIVIFWAAGNERGVSRCGTGYGSTAPPGNNKNAISVGALNSNNDTMTSFSSWGPADDGRIRPTISAPGCQSNGDGGVTSIGSFGDTDTSVKCGTSMASPTAAGVGALLYEGFKDRYGASAEISNQLMKVFLIQGAQDRGNVGPDNAFGYGSIRAADSMDFIRTDNWAESSIAGTGSVESYTITVAPGTAEFEATLAWDDVPGTPNVNPNLVNDLDLVVIDPQGTRFFPWTVDPANPGAPAVQNQVDRLNNIEQVTVNSPTPGVWRVEVVGFDVASGPQSYALGATGNSNTLAAGALALGLTSSVPDLLDPGATLDVTATLNTGTDTLVGDVTAFYRTAAGDSFTPIVMNDLGNDEFGATLPGALCPEDLEFFLQAEGAVAGVITVPAGGASNAFAVPVGAIEILADEDFETSAGWTVGAAGDSATTGVWERAAPQGTGAQPGSDASDDGSIAWVTQAAAGGSVGTFDIDGGATTLTSAVYDLSGAPNATLSYSRWYSNDQGANPNTNTFIVEISNNGGSTWQNLETVGPAGAGTGGGWIEASFDLSSVFGGAVLDQVRVRFVAADNTGAIVEAAVDEFRVDREFCENPTGGNCIADFTGPALDGVPDNTTDASDLTFFLNEYVAQFGTAGGTGPNGFSADRTGPSLQGNPDGTVDGADLTFFLNAYITEFAGGCQ